MTLRRRKSPPKGPAKPSRRKAAEAPRSPQAAFQIDRPAPEASAPPEALEGPIELPQPSTHVVTWRDDRKSSSWPAWERPDGTTIVDLRTLGPRDELRFDPTDRALDLVPAWIHMKARESVPPGFAILPPKVDEPRQRQTVEG